jgi:hypothetical protein
VHDERGLHGHGRAVARIDAFDLAGDEPVGDIARARAAIVLRQRGAQQPEFAHLVHDLAVEALVAEGRDDARHQPLLGIGPRGVADHALVLRELLLEMKRVLPVEGGLRGRL